MVRKDQQGDYEDIVPLPVSTREPGEAAGLLPNGATSDKRVGAFDVEFDIEDDVLLNWQHTRPSGWWLRRLPRSWQQVPECWLRLSKQQRNLVISGAVALAVLTLCVTILGAAWVGKDKQHFTAQYMSAQDSPYCSWSDLYLPKGVRPVKYTLHVKSTLQPPYTVTGEVDIQLQAAEATPCVVLHANGLQVQSVELLVYEGDSNMHKQHPAGIKGSVRSSNKTSQQVVLQFPHALPRAPLVPVLRLKFSYKLQEGLDGFYRSSYIDAANETRVMASTQFESLAARKAFPCFDEPSFKAVFEVKVSAPPPPMVVLSNMPLSHTHEHTGSSGSHKREGRRRLRHEGEEEHEEGLHSHSDSSSSSQKVLTEDDLIAYHFLPTPPMSTYLVAWVVGELSHNELQCPLALAPTPAPSSGGSSSGRRRLRHEGEEEHEHEHREGGEGGKHNVTVRVWGTNDRVQQFGHARDVACAALQEMEKLTQVSFPLPKLDLVAIPNFAAGAMENWGLLTYRERALLVDDSKDDMHQRYAIATTVAHETAHQWFGNLATLDDWTELWINEGLASYMEAVLADTYQPGMGYLTNFFTGMTSAGLEADGSLASHPLSINRPIRKLSEVDNWFDSVSYNKGAAVLRMLRAWVNRADSTATGLQAVPDAPSAASSEYNAKFASTSQEWVPHLRRLQQQQQTSEGSRRRKGGVTSSGSDDSSSSSNGAGGSSQPAPHPSWTAHKYSKGPSIQASISPLLHTESGELSGLEVLPAGAAAPPTPKPAAAAAAAKRQPSAATAISVGSRAGWLAAQQQQPARELPDGGAGSAGGGDTFVAGLSRYVKAHAYGNSGYRGLWDSIGEAAGEPVEQMMSTWTLRRGFPIVTVSLGPQDTGSSRREVKLDQVPYHAPRTYMVGLPFEPEMYCNDWSDDPADSSWWIPVALRLPGVNNFEWHSFNSCSSAVQVDMPRNTQPWVLANTGRFGFYRVNYSEPLWTALAAVSTSPQAAISSVDFAGLLDDAYSLSHVRQLNISVFLNLIQALGSRARPELPPWDTALGWLQRMTDVLSTAALLDSNGEGQGWKDCMAHLKKYVTHKVTKPFIQNVRVPGQDDPGLTFKVSSGDPPELRLLRPLVLEAAGFLGYTQAMNTAVDLVAQQASGQADAVAPDVAKAVYALAAASGSEAAYTTLVNMYEQATDAADKDRALRALARVTTKPLISKTLEYALSPAVRTQDVAVLLVRLAKQGGLGFNMTWQFVIDRADGILEKYGVDDVTYSLGLKLNDLAKLFVDEALLERLKALDKAKPQIFSPTFFEEANEARMLNHDFLRFQGQDACRWLADAARRV